MEKTGINNAICDSVFYYWSDYNGSLCTNRKTRINMKKYFNFRFDNDLKERVKEYGEDQEPKESISRVIHKALHKLLKPWHT